MLTVKIAWRPGLEILAKMFDGEPCALTYANLTQARKKAATLGEPWAVYGIRPYYVGRPEALSVKGESDAQV